MSATRRGLDHAAVAVPRSFRLRPSLREACCVELGLLQLVLLACRPAPMQRRPPGSSRRYRRAPVARSAACAVRVSRLRPLRAGPQRARDPVPLAAHVPRPRPGGPSPPSRLPRRRAAARPDSLRGSASPGPPVPSPRRTSRAARRPRPFRRESPSSGSRRYPGPSTAVFSSGLCTAPRPGRTRRRARRP